MNIFCYHCNKYFSRDKEKNGKIIEEYRNVYGTFCPLCNNFVASENKNDIYKEIDLKMELLRESMRERLRKKFRS